MSEERSLSANETDTKLLRRQNEARVERARVARHLRRGVVRENDGRPLDEDHGRQEQPGHRHLLPGTSPRPAAERHQPPPTLVVRRHQLPGRRVEKALRLEAVRVLPELFVVMDSSHQEEHPHAAGNLGVSDARVADGLVRDNDRTERAVA